MSETLEDAYALVVNHKFADGIYLIRNADEEVRAYYDIINTWSDGNLIFDPRWAPILTQDEEEALNVTDENMEPLPQQVRHQIKNLQNEANRKKVEHKRKVERYMDVLEIVNSASFAALKKKIGDERAVALVRSVLISYQGINEYMQVRKEYFFKIPV